jgi:hypothetical protein
MLVRSRVGALTARVGAMTAIVAMMLTARAAAEPLVVVVRDGGDAALAIARLRGQLADLEIELTIVPGRVEPALDAQLVAASRLAASRGARVVVWFVARGEGLAVAIATPGDRRLFVREIPAADASAVAEAAAVSARGALRAIGQGGTIGVEVVPRREAPVRSPRRYGLELAVSWQVANVSRFTGAGIKYILSTGGAAGTFSCASDAGFNTFINRWASPNLIGVDFDIEAGQSPTVINDLIRRIKTAHVTFPGLRFSLTLATLANNNGATTAQSLGAGVADSFNVFGDETLAAVSSVLGFTGSAASWPSYVICFRSSMINGHRCSISRARAGI